MGAGGSTNGAAGDEEVAYRLRPRYAGPGTQPVQQAPWTWPGENPDAHIGLKHFTPPHEIGAWGAGGTTYGLVIEVCRSSPTLWSGAQQVGQQPPPQVSFMVTPRALGHVICGHLSPSALPVNDTPQASAFAIESMGQGVTRVEPWGCS